MSLDLIMPQIYSLLLCSRLDEDPATGGWVIQPFSEVGVPRLPVKLELTILAQIMAPPGDYRLGMRLYQADDPANTLHVLPPRTLTVREGKNLDYVVATQLEVLRLGLYLIEASLDGYETRRTLLRITAA
jgi:hypothetical protein